MRSLNQELTFEVAEKEFQLRKVEIWDTADADIETD